MPGKYDDILAGLTTPVSTGISSSLKQKTGGKYDDILSGIGSNSYVDIYKQENNTGVLDSIGKVLGSRPELQAYGRVSVPDVPQDPIVGAFKAAQQTLASPLRAAITSSELPRKVGEVIAEEGGRAGYPKTAASIGTLVSIVPELLATGGGLKTLYKSASPIAKAIRTTPKALGKQYQFQNKVAGVSGDMPVFAGKVPGYETSSADLGDIQAVKNMALNPPVSYPQTPGAFFNFSKARMQSFGDQLMPDEVMVYKDKLGSLIKLGEDKVNKIFNKNTAFAEVSQLNKMATELENKVFNKALAGAKIPEGYESTRDALNSLYGLSKKIRPDLGEAIKAGISKIWPHFRWGTILVP